MLCKLVCSKEGPLIDDGASMRHLDVTSGNIFVESVVHCMRAVVWRFVGFEGVVVTLVGLGSLVLMTYD